MSEQNYFSQAARDAQAQNYGDKNYWNYLDQSALEKALYYTKIGSSVLAKLMLTRSLGEALKGNDGD